MTNHQVVLRAPVASAALVLVGVLLLLIGGTQPGWGATVSSRRPKSDQNCTNHLQIIDKCSSMATYSFTTQTNQYPNSTSDMKASCERISEGLKCLKIYGKCLSALSRRSVVSYSSARSRHSKKLCANMADPKTLDFIKVGPCIANSNKRALMISNERELITAIQSMATNTTLSWDDRLHGSCCAASNYKTKTVKDMEPQCAKLKEAQEDLLNSMVGELLETACPEPNRLKEICAKLPKHKSPKEWQAVSLTSAALDLIVALSDNPKT